MRDNWHSLIIIALSGHLDESLMFWIVNENSHLEVIEQLVTYRYYFLSDNGETWFILLNAAYVVDQNLKPFYAKK